LELASDEISNHMNPESKHSCPFCRIAVGEEGDYTYVTSKEIILQTDNFTSFIGGSSYDVIPCKILVIPNQHISTFQDLPA
jgi:diadenosine tetraphosphate (Ap4A) HIT family hydrolase